MNDQIETPVERRPISEKQIEAIVKLPGPKRYSHFIKEVVNLEEVWGLYSQGGWRLLGGLEGETLFPLWPAKEYVMRFDSSPSWEPKSIPLEELMDVLLPKLEKEKIGIAVFPLSDKLGVVPSLQTLTQDLETEMSLYE
jgi:hypothetical protein